MKKVAEVLCYMRDECRGTNQELTAARVGMSVKTARKYEGADTLDCQLARTTNHERESISPHGYSLS